jgi:hypothetical protein
VQARVSVVTAGTPQLPALHAYVVIVRDWRPLSSHALS